jgi:DNA-binding GntR family transcriptional regulator
MDIETGQRAKPRRKKEAIPTTPIPKGEGRGRAYDRLRERILALELQPGSALDEATIGKDLDVSRTPLREALVRLAAEGLVELLPNRGARVAPIELPQLQEHLEAFELLQRTATVLAAQRRTEKDIVALRALCLDFEKLHAAGDVPGMMNSNLRFHQAVGAAAGNRYLQKMYDSVLVDGLRVARLAMAYECYGSVDAYDQHMQSILQEHRSLVEAIVAKDVATASALSDSHSDLARMRVTDYLSRNLTRTIGVPGHEARGAAHV